MSLLATLATIFGTAMAFSNIPQAHKIFKRKSARDISKVTYSLLAFGSFIWLLYGIELGNLPIMITYSVGTLSCLIVLTQCFLYK
jgi:MtN3 and saliva related transmembrane protein